MKKDLFIYISFLFSFKKKLIVEIGVLVVEKNLRKNRHTAHNQQTKAAARNKFET